MRITRMTPHQRIEAAEQESTLAKFVAKRESGAKVAGLRLRDEQ
jgi:hypothetical protein